MVYLVRSIVWSLDFCLMIKFFLMCVDPILFILGIIVSIILGVFFITIVLSMLSLKYFPKSKFSSWSRRHFITDEDLEP